MRFSELSKYLQKLEDTTKRLEMVDILSDLIKNLDVEETDRLYTWLLVILGRSLRE